MENLVYIAEVAVIGCGAMGAATCSHLARRGVKVIGIERFTRGHTYGSSTGWTRHYREAYMESVQYVQLIKEAGRQFQQMQKEMNVNLFSKCLRINIGPRDSK